MTLLNTIRQMICERLCVDAPPHPFTSFRHRFGRHIRDVLEDQYPDAHIRIADSDYGAVHLADFNIWLKADSVSERAYQAQHHDCDDFARALRCKMFQIGRSLNTTLAVAYCEGNAPGGYHAFNLLLDGTDHIHIVEPQTDRVVPAEESEYNPDFIQL